jgi:hypothetical protein
LRGTKALGWLVLVWLVATPAAAADYRAPKTASGAPDLNGLWSNSSLTDLERPEAFKSLAVPEKDAKAWEKDHLGKAPMDPEDTVGGHDSEWWERDVGLARIRGQVRTSWLVAPANGQLPTSKAAKAARKARHQQRLTNFDNPEGRSADERCTATDAAGPPITNGGYNDNYQFVQTPGELVILAEYMSVARIVRLAGKGAPAPSHPPPDIRGRMGDAIGHWEGATLVIETTNFTPAEADPFNLAPGADMRVIERLTRTGPDEITYAFRVWQPAVYDQSWAGEMVFHATKGPIYEFACHEGNYAMTHMLAGARRDEHSPPPAAAATKPAGQ